jgi:hypothetical protein
MSSHQINENNYIVWSANTNANGDGDIFLFDGSTIIKLSDNDNRGAYPRINNNNHVVWGNIALGDIFYYDGSTVTEITDPYSGGYYPQINDNDHIVWSGISLESLLRGTDMEIFLYNGSTVTQITENDYDDGLPTINNSGDIVWAGDGGIYYYDGASTTRLTENYSGKYGLYRLNNNGYVTWVEEIDGDSNSELFLYNGLDVTRLTYDNYEDEWPELNDENVLIWIKHDDSGNEVLSYDIDQEIFEPYVTIFLSVPISGSVAFHEINDNEFITWLTVDPAASSGLKICLFDGVISTTISSKTTTTSYPKINNNGHIAWLCDDIMYYYDSSNIFALTADGTISNVNDVNGGGTTTPGKTQVSGTVTYGGDPVTAMVLANGKYMFTGGGAGAFDLSDVPFDANGQITLYAFCSGLSPYKTILTEGVSDFEIEMVKDEGGKELIVTIDSISESSTKSGWYDITGTVANESATPLTAMVLANGKYMFTGNPVGEFNLTVPLDGIGKITLYGFCSGLTPYKIVGDPVTLGQ